MKTQVGSHLANESNENHETSENDRLLIHNIELLGDGSGNQAASEYSSTGLGDEAGRGREFVDDF